MKTKLTNEQVFNIVYLLKTKYPDLEKFDKRFNFAVSRTLSYLQPIAADLLKARTSSIEKYNEFEQKKKVLVNTYSEDGEKFKSDEDKQKCQEEVIKLAEEYKEVLDERSKEIEIYNTILNDEVEVDIIKCKFEALPNDFNFEILRVFVKENDDEIEALL